MPNPKTPQRWPTKAAEAADDVQAYLVSIKDIARQIQMAAKQGDTGTALILAGDVREKALLAEHVLKDARRGEYKQ